MIPKFCFSEWFVPEVDNWHLKPDAPKEVADEFEAYMKERQEAEDEGITID